MKGAKVWIIVLMLILAAEILMSSRNKYFGGDEPAMIYQGLRLVRHPG